MSMRKGFSLIELSIVLVILGLLVGGILSGQSLIRASELRSVSTEYQRYTTAIATFRDKYFSIPGDFRDATKFWGTSNTIATCGSNSGVAASATGMACDGNGNSVLEHLGGAGAGGEAFQVWSQLALAGLVEGTYSGKSGISTHDALIGTNVPKAKLANAGWSFQQLDFSGGGGGFYSLNNGNALFFGAQNTGSSSFNPLLKPEEAWNIDTKIDDGKPATGKLIAALWATCTTSTTANDFTKDYNLADKTNSCAFISEM